MGVICCYPATHASTQGCPVYTWATVTRKMGKDFLSFSTFQNSTPSTLPQLIRQCMYNFWFRGTYIGILQVWLCFGSIATRIGSFFIISNILILSGYNVINAVLSLLESPVYHRSCTQQQF
jgi:hypothetical protein